MGARRDRVGVIPRWRTLAALADRASSGYGLVRVHDDAAPRFRAPVHVGTCRLAEIDALACMFSCAISA